MALWTPDLLTELFAWYKADSLSLANNDPIDSLADSDSGTYTLTSSGAARPTYKTNQQNGLPVMEFSGAQWLTSGATSDWKFLHTSTGGTVIAVWKAGTVADPNTLYGLYGTNRGTVSVPGAYYIFDDRASVSREETSVIGGRLDLGPSGTNTLVSASPTDSFPANQYNVSSSVHDFGNATAANKALIGINGGSLSGNNTNGNSPLTSDPTHPLQLGAVGNNVFPLTGSIGEVCFFNSVLSTTNRQLVEGYLAWKWGTEALLPNTHPYYSAAPTVGRARRLINDGLFNRGLFNTGLMR